jgi:hypothetical protein
MPGLRWPGQVAMPGLAEVTASEAITPAENPMFKQDHTHTQPILQKRTLCNVFVDACKDAA